MHALALLAILEAKPGKEEELSAFLKSALPLATKETQTLSWFAFRIRSSKFGIFDTFPDEDGRNAHSMAKSPMRYSPRRTSCWLRRHRSRNPTSWPRSERFALRPLPLDLLGCRCF